MSFRSLQLPDPAVEAIETVSQFVFGSFFRFMIIFGIVLYAIAALFLEGTPAGHMGLYAATAVAIGVVGTLIVRLKFRNSY